jgi:glycosyltransferase involved in cell wall biosynthesis
MYSLVIPVYKNEASLPDLLKALEELSTDLDGRLEVVFVVDGSPDRSMELLANALPDCSFRSQLALLSRNFGSFAAIRAGLAEASGPYFAVMAADLQEPPELVAQFFRALESEPVDVTIGTRSERDDPVLARWPAQLFWALYRRFVQPEMPPGGVDVFGCNLAVRDRLLTLVESNSSLVGLLFWLGYRRKMIPYQRRARAHGESAWTFRGKLQYLSDSVFAFSDLPIRVLIGVGGLGLFVSAALGALVIAARMLGFIEVPGYAAIIITVVFFAALNTFGLGVIGSYVWRAFENTKQRPEAIVMSRTRHEGKPS